MTIDEVKSKIIEYLVEAGKLVNPSNIMSKYKWKTEEILAEFDIKKIKTFHRRSRKFHVSELKRERCILS